MSQTPDTNTPPAGEKLQKYLARAGRGSRRALEVVISEGRVTVDGKPAKLGDRVMGSEEIRMDGHRVVLSEDALVSKVLIYNKPVGEICTRNDPEGRPTIFQKLPPIKGGRWISVGRLDINTSGLLLLTNDGALANALMHPSSQIDREYRVRIFGKISEQVVANLTTGVELEDGFAKFTDVTLDEELEGQNQWATVTLMEGRNREVRRLWESQELQVSRLKRVRFGPIFLPSRVRRGSWEECDASTVEQLQKTAGIQPQSTEPVQPKRSGKLSAARSNQRRKRRS